MSWLVSAVGLILACVASTGARALSDYSHHDLEELCQKRNRVERLKAVLHNYRRASIAAELVEIILVFLVIVWNVAGWIHSGTAAQLQALSAQWRETLLSAGVLLLGTAFATVFVPRAISLLWATPVVYYAWPVWRFFDRIMSPLLFLSRVTEVVFQRGAGVAAPEEPEEQFEEEIRTLVSEGEREGFLEEEDREMIEGVIKLGDVTVSEIMTPRTEMVCLSTDVSWEEMLQTVIKEGHTRIPVYQETRDNIVGILYIKDLLPYLAKPSGSQQPPWTSLLREPMFVPETKPVRALMQEFQRTRNHLAVVLDEYGGVSGIITLEDILEEIVGEIADELDHETVREIVVRENGEVEVSGTARVEEINRRLGLQLPEDDEYDTVAGLIMTHLGRVPPVGETVTISGVTLKVVEGDRRRIRRILIAPNRTEAQPEQGRNPSEIAEGSP